MIRDFKLQPFSFKFEETTTSQVKRQCDGYVQFWSNEKRLTIQMLLLLLNAKLLLIIPVAVIPKSSLGGLFLVIVPMETVL